MPMRIAFLAFVVATIGVGTVSAHHSYAAYFTDQNSTVEGRITRVLYASPHAVLTIKNKDSETYTIEWQSNWQLRAMGVTASTLKVGDWIVVSGSPKRNPAEHMLSLIKEIHRPADSWAWCRAGTIQQMNELALRNCRPS